MNYRKSFAAAAAVVVVFLGLSVYWRMQKAGSENLLRTVLIPAPGQVADTEKRRQQRIYGFKDEIVMTVQEGKAEVASFIPDGPVFLVGQYDDMSGELCLFAYSREQWESLDNTLAKLGSEDLKETWLEIKKRAEESAVRDGKLAIPEQLWKDYLDGSGTTTLLKYTDRSELWDTTNLDEYRRGIVTIEPNPNWGKN